MGKGIDLAREQAPEHAQIMDDFKDQFLICLINRLGKQSKDGVVTIPVSEIDNTGGFVMTMSVTNEAFNFKVIKKH